MNVFERFIDTARRALYLARFAAGSEECREIEPRHILIGVLWREATWNDTTVGNLFTQLRIDPELLVQAVRERAGAARARASALQPKRHIPFSSDTRTVLMDAMQEADKLQYRWVGAEHLLLVILNQRQTDAGTALANLGLNLQDVRAYLSANIEELPAYLPRPVARASATPGVGALPTWALTDKDKQFLAVLSIASEI